MRLAPVEGDSKPLDEVAEHADELASALEKTTTCRKGALSIQAGPLPSLELAPSSLERPQASRGKTFSGFAASTARGGHFEQVAGVCQAVNLVEDDPAAGVGLEKSLGIVDIPTGRRELAIEEDGLRNRPRKGSLPNAPRW